MEQFKFSTAFAKRWWKPKSSDSLINQIQGPVPPAILNIYFLPIKSKSVKDVKTKPQLFSLIIYGDSKSNPPSLVIPQHDDCREK